VPEDDTVFCIGVFIHAASIANGFKALFLISILLCISYQD